MKRLFDAVRGEAPVKKVKLAKKEDIEKEFNVSKILLESVESEKRRPYMRPGNVYIRASGIYYLCPREEALRSKFKITTTEKHDPSGMMRMALGTMFHTWLQNEIFHNYLSGSWKCRDCHAEMGNVKNPIYRPKVCPGCGGEDLRFMELHFVDPELLFGGHADGFILYRVDGSIQKGVIDFKTAAQESYEGVMTWGMSKGYIWQQNAYMMLTDLPYSLLLYVNKNIPEFRSHIIMKDEAIIEAIKVKCLETIKAVNSMAGPKPWIPVRRECDSKTCTRAKKCPVRNECFALKKEAHFEG